MLLPELFRVCFGLGSLKLNASRTTMPGGEMKATQMEHLEAEHAAIETAQWIAWQDSVTIY